MANVYFSQTAVDRRQSVLSDISAATSTMSSSYRTAPLSPSSRTSFAPSTSSYTSLNTVTANGRDKISYPLQAPAQDRHFVKAIQETVSIEPTGSYVAKTILDGDLYKSGPPPRIEQQDEEEMDEGFSEPNPALPSPPSPPSILYPVKSDPTPRQGQFVLGDISERQPSTSSNRSNAIHITEPLPRLTTTDTSRQAYYSRSLVSSSPFKSADASSTPSSSKANTHLSVDGYPPVPQPHQIPPFPRTARRNTTGSSFMATHKRGVSMSLHGKAISQPLDDAVLGEGSIELADDIEIHAERIRRERMSKRFKQQQEAEAALTRAESRSQPEAPLVGNLIGEDHANYVLMYNMLTGIRIGVSRCQAKVKRPLTEEDFKARHKFSFDIVGNELTPSAKYDFKFKDYAPWVFRYLREDIFYLDPADYLLSLTAKYILSELGSPGKSGSFFYFSRDYRFIIKTIHHAEHKFLLRVLPRYYDYVKENPHTLLSRFYGLHRVKLPHGRKIHFVIMNNLFPPHRDVHETYDLKGSTVGREYPAEKAATNPRAVLKDLNWINKGMTLELGPEKRALLTEQLRRDAEFLKSIWVMDYSLLVGVHNMQRGNKDNLRRNTLKVFSPMLPESSISRRKAKSQFGPQSPEAIAMRRAMRISDIKRLGSSSELELDLADELDSGGGAGNSSGVESRSRTGGPRVSSSRSSGGGGGAGSSSGIFVFYQDEGGLRATDEANETMATIYYFGVIDILTPYGLKKKMEHFWKGMSSDRHKISPVPPGEYADRFFSFMKAIMRGGGGGAKFKAKAKSE